MILNEKYKVKDIALALNRYRRTIEREIKRGTIIKKIENPYLSRNPNVPDYIEKKFYSAKEVQKKADFPVLICTKTIYNMIDRGIFATLQIKTYL